MQSLHPDASTRFKSLDSTYYNEAIGARQQVAIYAHKASRPEEIAVEVGDILMSAANQWNGFSKVNQPHFIDKIVVYIKISHQGTNKRTNQTGLYPSFKAVDKHNIVDFPSYSEVDNAP